MPNYYEQRKVQPSATTAEIEGAIEEQYNQWRRLVTHHDPNVVDQANRTLRDLEQIRAMLSDPVKRAAYDVGVGISGQIGGLADPEALLRTAAPPPPRPPQGPTPKTAATQRVDAWVCLKCGMANPIGTRHCKGCGNILGIECPNCGKLTEAVASHCAECGANLDKMRREKEKADIAQQKQMLQKKIDELKGLIREEQHAIQDLEQLRRKALILPDDIARLGGFSLWNKRMLRIAALAALGLFMINVGLDIARTVNALDLRLGAVAFLVMAGLVLAVNAFLALRSDFRQGIPDKIAEHVQRIGRIEQEVKQLQAEWTQSDRQSGVLSDA